MVKAKKKKKKVKRKISQDMFVKGGLNLLMMGGFIGIFYQVLYMLIMVETFTTLEEVSYTLFIRIFREFGIFFLFLGLIFVCYSILKEKEFFTKHTGTFLASGASLSLVGGVYALYDIISRQAEQVFSSQTFLISVLPVLMSNISRIYLFMGALLLGIAVWGFRTQRKWAAALFVAGAGTGCGVFVLLMYGVYENTTFFLEMYGETNRELIISRFLLPDMLQNISLLLVFAGIVSLSASYIWTAYKLRRWAGRLLLFGGVAGAFHGFIRLGMDSQEVRNEITGVRQSIMNLTPYSTVLRDQMLTVETLREFYIKKVLPLYLEHSLWVIVFTGITAVAIYLWVRER